MGSGRRPGRLDWLYADVIAEAEACPTPTPKSPLRLSSACPLLGRVLRRSKSPTRNWLGQRDKGVRASAVVRCVVCQASPTRCTCLLPLPGYVLK